MSPKRHIILLSLALFISTLIIVALTALLSRSNIGADSSQSNPIATIEQRVSEGERVLVPQEEVSGENTKFRRAKQRGVEAFAKQEYSRSVTEFRQALAAYKNAPETFIYLNNAEIGKSQSYTLAVAAPLRANPSVLAILRGVALAQQEINKEGGIDGFRLKIKLADDENDPEIAQELASFLADDPAVLGVIGHYSSGVTLAAKEIYDAQQLPAISAASTSIDLSKTTPGETRYVFRTVPNDAFAATALARHLLNYWQLKNVAVFFDSQSNYSVSLKSEFAEEVTLGNGTVVAEFDFSQFNFDPNQAWRDSINAGAESLMLAAHSGVFDATFDVIRQNAGELKLLGGDELYDFKILDELGEQALGMVVATPWDVSVDPEAEFTQRSLELWDARVNWLSAMAYDAMQAFIRAIAQEPNREGIQKAFVSSEFSVPGASDSVRFMASGDRQGRVYLMEVKRSDPENLFPSGTDFDFIPVKPQS